VPVLGAGDDGAGDVAGGGSEVGAAGDASVDVVPVGLLDDVVPVGGLVGVALVGDGSLLPVLGVPVGVADGVGLVDVPPAGAGGASSRIATISALNSSSWAEIWASEYAVMSCPNWVSRAQTSPSASS
jgi:hypothetical protein